MRYLLLLFSAPDAGPAPGSPEEAAEMPQWFAVTEEMAQAGVMQGGEALQPVETATTVRVRDGKVSATDGPFAETKELLGGYYLLDVADLDEAMAWAAKLPNAPYGSIEIRPVMELPT
ncbi:MAG: YciI family protein [Acidimicrobiales bacterium]|nr:YciI family protein [Acidimicrobiales bacterium]